MTNDKNYLGKYFFVLFFCIFASGYAVFCLNATVALYVKDLGGSAGFSGVLTIFFTLFACIFRLAGGNFSDKLGRRLVIISGGLILTVGTSGYIWSSSVPLLMFFRAMQGIGYAVMSIGATTAIIDIIPPEKLGEGIGISSLGNTLSGSIAPLIGVALISGPDYSVVFLTTAAIALSGALAAILFCDYERHEPYKSQLADNRLKKAESIETDKNKSFIKSMIWKIFEKEAVIPALFQTAFTTGFSATYVFMTLFAVIKKYPYPGLYFTMSAVFSIVARVAGGRLADRGRTLLSLSLGLILTAASFFFLSLFDDYFVYYICGALFGIGSGMVTPVTNKLAVMNAKPHRRGAATATYNISNDIGIGVGGLLWGMLIDRIGFEYVFLCTAGWLLCALIIYYMSYFIGHSKKQIHTM